jgi:3-hydroxyacyl-CoA dehydrogenase
MLYADTVGLPNVVRAHAQLRREPRRRCGFWQPAPLLAKLAEPAARFN